MVFRLLPFTAVNKRGSW